MPISIKEAVNLPKQQPERAKVDWAEVIQEIVKSEEFWSVMEVTEIFVENKVKKFRTKTVLDRAVEEGLLTRVWDKKRYVYGKRFD